MKTVMPPLPKRRKMFLPSIAFIGEESGKRYEFFFTPRDTKKKATDSLKQWSKEHPTMKGVLRGVYEIELSTSNFSVRLEWKTK